MAAGPPPPNTPAPPRPLRQSLPLLPPSRGHRHLRAHGTSHRPPSWTPLHRPPGLCQPRRRMPATTTHITQPHACMCSHTHARVFSSHACSSPLAHSRVYTLTHRQPCGVDQAPLDPTSGHGCSRPSSQAARCGVSARELQPGNPAPGQGSRSARALESVSVTEAG